MRERAEPATAPEYGKTEISAGLIGTTIVAADGYTRALRWRSGERLTTTSRSTDPRGLAPLLRRHSFGCPTCRAFDRWDSCRSYDATCRIVVCRTDGHARSCRSGIGWGWKVTIHP